MSPPRVHRVLPAALALMIPTLAAGAGGTGDDFRAGPSVHDGSGGFQLVHPTTGGRGAGYLGGAFTTGEYFDAPDNRRRIAGVHMAGGYAVADWLRFEADVPFMTSVAQDDLSTSGLGDIQLSATVPFTFPGTRGFGIGLVPFAEVPTQAASSSELLEGGAALVMGAGDGTFGWRANAIARADQEGNSAVTVGIGGNARLSENFTAGVEVLSTRPAGPTDPAATGNNPVEASLYGHWGQARRTSVFFGLTTGLVADAGSPLYRATVGLSFKRAGLVGDPDADGIFGIDDDCPTTPEDPDGYLDQDGCPDPDDDEDGVADVIDRCPDEAEDVDGHEDRDGCPDVDNDFDGVRDALDACPLEPGIGAAEGCPDQDNDTVADHKDECVTRPGSPQAMGCPDYDNDRVPDYRDLCPTEPISLKIDPYRSNGCPTRAYYSGGRIMILERVNFETGSAVISAESYALLRDVARTLQQNPDIAVVEIGGHTDSIGSNGANLRLSRARAKAVRAFLVQQGIESRRLKTRGYGETMPIDSNATDAGRYQNRRVEFVVLETVSDK